MAGTNRSSSIAPPPPSSRDVDLSGLFVGDRRDGPPRREVRAPSSMRRSTPEPTSRRRAAERALLARGTVIDKYRIEALIGTGGFAAVYRATHLLLRVPVAIKLLRPRVLSRDPRIARHLVEEARYAARIDHPNVVRIHDVTHTDEITYIVMELIDGSSLARMIEERGPIPPAEVASIAIDVAEGLRAGLEAGLIHRDIKPANILVSRGGKARIVDFGLAYAGSLDTGESGDMVPGRPGQIVGTRGYMAPEQVRDPRRVDFRSDVYSLGVTLCEALTGGSVRSRRGDAELLRTVPLALGPLVRRMISAAPEDRPTSYDSLLSGLEQAARALRR
ncbi:MAG TPA: serine/threonine-protein kinase [Polyangiaceae bacterium]|jgi:serine/threonine-protein kinase